MAFDELGGDADEGPSPGPPIHPDDRLWRHPSEVGRSLQPVSGTGTGDEAGNAGGRARRRHRPAGTLIALAVTAGLVGSSLTVGVLFLGGAFDRQVVERVYEQPMVAARNFEVAGGAAAGGDTVAAMARRVEPALARVEVSTPLGPETGTAVAVRREGYYLTSADLLENKDDVWLALPNHQPVRATVVGVDRVTNLGVLRAGGDPVAVPTWGASSALVPGADAVVVGAAERGARGPSVAKGVVSAVGVRYQLDEGTTLHDLIRTDANMIPGSKGGVLLDSAGAVVGIITTVGKDEAGVKRIGFAMPIEYASALADSFILFGHPAPVWLGIVGRSLPREQAEQLGISGGVAIDTVVPQSPAALAEVAANDIIVAVDGTPIDTWSAMNLALRRLNPGDPLTLTIQRGTDTIGALTYVARPPESYTDLPAR
jgi:S1-C subfamily serine protease